MLTPLHTYVDAWRRHDIDAVLATLTHDCVVIESYGPVYRGRPRVEQWMHAWSAAGGRVDDWDITSHTVAGELVVAEWTFACTWQDKPGCSVARLQGDRIAHLREYATTAALHEWTGAWRDQQ